MTREEDVRSGLMLLEESFRRLVAAGFPRSVADAMRREVNKRISRRLVMATGIRFSSPSREWINQILDNIKEAGVKDGE